MVTTRKGRTSEAATPAAPSPSVGAKRRRGAPTEEDRRDTAEVLLSGRQNEFSDKTWWMVDLDASGVDQGATPLVRWCIRVHGWDAPKARRVLAAYRQFLTLKTEHEDWDATVLSPCPLVDQMWQQHVLDVTTATIRCCCAGAWWGTIPTGPRRERPRGTRKRRGRSR